MRLMSHSGPGLLQRLWATTARYCRTMADHLFVGPWRVQATVSDMDQVPPRIRTRHAFLVATEARRKWLVFECPCGEGHRILLNLDRSRRPFWTLRVARDGRFTLRPSVDHRDDRRSCHYFVSNGTVEWVSPNGSTHDVAGRIQHA